MNEIKFASELNKKIKKNEFKKDEKKIESF
jgi:hypothetical protein